MATNAKRCSYSSQASHYKRIKGKKQHKIVGGKNFFGKKILNCADTFNWVKIGEKNGRISGNKW